MKNIKLSTEAIVGIIAGIIILIVLFYAFGKKREIASIETQKQAENAFVDSLQNVIKQTNLYYNDTLSKLDNEIETLKTEIDNTRSKQVKYENYAKLDRMVSMSRFLIQENEEILNKLKDEPLKSEYTPQFLADLIEALIDNIKLKEKRIIELEAEVSVLKEKLEKQQFITQRAFSERDAAKAEKERLAREAEKMAIEAENKEKELLRSEDEKRKLLIFQYILGSRKELLKEDILEKRFLRKECFIANEISNERFSTLKIETDKKKYKLGEVESNQIFCSPSIAGATTSIENNQLVIHISDVNQFVKTGRAVFYY